MTHYHLATMCNVLFFCVTTELRLTGCGICTACSDIQTSQEGKITILLDNMKYTKEKKVNAAYIRLMRYFINIYRYINLFRKALRVILFLIIPIDKIPRQLLFTFCPTLRGHFLLDCFESANTNTDRSMQHLHATLHDN